MQLEEHRYDEQKGTKVANYSWSVITVKGTIWGKKKQTNKQTNTLKNGSVLTQLGTKSSWWDTLAIPMSPRVGSLGPWNSISAKVTRF